MFAEERRNQILNLLSKQNSVTVNNLANHFDVSSATIRTDLNFLADNNKVQRTHGGAVSINTSESINENTSYQVRKELNIEEKGLIASKAILEIKNDMCIALDASSTCYELAKLISESNLRITVVTNGLRTASILKENLKLNVIVIGGIIKGESNAIEGLLGSEILDKVHIDIFFFSSSGISLDLGFTDFNLQEIELKKLIINKAAKNIALIDFTKFNKKSISQFASFNDIDHIISDTSLSPDTIQRYTLKNEIIIAY